MLLLKHLRKRLFTTMQRLMRQRYLTCLWKHSQAHGSTHLLTSLTTLSAHQTSLQTTLHLLQDCSILSAALARRAFLPMYSTACLTLQDRTKQHLHLRFRILQRALSDCQSRQDTSSFLTLYLTVAREVLFLLLRAL